MASRQERQLEKIHRHLSDVQEKYEPSCPVCEDRLLREEGKFSMIGTQPRMPRAFGSLKCPKCGYVMFFELPDVGTKEVS